MSKLHDTRPGCSQLGMLHNHNHYRARRDALADRLDRLCKELEERHLEAAQARFSFDPRAVRDQVSALLQAEHDDVAFELAHVRLALAELEKEGTRLSADRTSASPRAVA